MVDLDPNKLLAKGLTPLDVVNAVNAQNLTLPAGTAKIGDKQYTIKTNSIPATIGDLNNIPLKFANDATVFIKDVGQVRDAYAVQQNIVRKDGLRAVLLTRDQERQRLDARRGERGQGGARRGACRGTCRPEHQRAVRSVDLRHEFGGQRGARRFDRRRAYRADDPSVSRLLAVDP